MGRPQRGTRGCTTLPSSTSTAANSRAVERLIDHDYPIEGAEDHGAIVSVYLSDPDGNGIELYYDRPREDWFDSRGIPILKAEPFDPRDLLAELSQRS